MPAGRRCYKCCPEKEKREVIAPGSLKLVLYIVKYSMRYGNVKGNGRESTGNRGRVALLTCSAKATANEKTDPSPREKPRGFGDDICRRTSAQVRCQQSQGRSLVEPLAGSRNAGYNHSVTQATTSKRVKVLFFGRLRELAGCAEDIADFANAGTIEELFSGYATRNPELAKYRSSVVASRNQEFAAWDTPLRSGDEFAFLPPVSGG
jgi:sulfur-carrier protein